MQKKIQDVYDFIDRAIKSRKYPENTGMALKTALKLFEGVLNEEERDSVDIFKGNIDQIYKSVFSKNKEFNPSSLLTYKSRVLKALSDYEKYGIEPTKMANWTPKIRVYSKKTTRSSREVDAEVNNHGANSAGGSAHVFDFVGGVRLLIPRTTQFTEAVLDGALKEIKVALKSFSEEHGGNDKLESKKVT